MYKNFHTKPCMFTVPGPQCIHVSSRKLKLPKRHSYQQSTNNPYPPTPFCKVQLYVVVKCRNECRVKKEVFMAASFTQHTPLQAHITHNCIHNPASINNSRSKHIKKGWKEVYLSGQTQSANFGGNPLYQAAKRHLKNSSTVKHDQRWDEKLNHLSVFGWAVLFSCPVLGNIAYRK